MCAQKDIIALIVFLQLSELEATTDPLKATCVPSKIARRPSVASKILPLNSEKLKLSVSQFRMRKKRTVQALKHIHCDSHASTSEEGHKTAVNDGLWTTLIGSATNQEVNHYISNSKRCMNSIIPDIMQCKVKDYAASQANKIRSMRVLYEGGLVGKRKYTSVRNSSDVMNEPTGKKQKNQKAEILPGLEFPKILPYKALMAFLKTIDIGEVTDLETFATKLSIESVPGVYRPLKSFLLKLADLYLDLHKETPLLHWFNSQEGLLWVSVGADGAPFGRDDTATGRLV